MEKQQKYPNNPIPKSSSKKRIKIKKNLAMALSGKKKRRIIYQGEKSVILPHYTSIKKVSIFPLKIMLMDTLAANSQSCSPKHHKFTAGPRYYQQKSYSFGIFMTPNLSQMLAKNLLLATC